MPGEDHVWLDSPHRLRERAGPGHVPRQTEHRRSGCGQQWEGGRWEIVEGYLSGFNSLYDVHPDAMSHQEVDPND